MSNLLRTFVDRAESAGTLPDLFEAFSDYAARLGADLVSYNIYSLQLRRVPFCNSLIFSNYPKEWEELNKRLNQSANTPFIQYPRLMLQPILFRDLLEEKMLNKDEKELIRLLTKSGIEYGLAVPVHGPYGTFGVCTIAAPHKDLKLSTTEIAFLQFACTRLHHAYMQLSDALQAQQPKKLSRRQQEVLTLVANGMSNAQIAEHLGVYESTVDTTLRRAFKKLDVHNRTDAALKALSAGMIMP